MQDLDLDTTSVQGFETAGQNMIIIEPWQCPKCFVKFGSAGAGSSMINVITAEGDDTWCHNCFNEGLLKGTCLKKEKLSKKEKRKLKKIRK